MMQVSAARAWLRVRDPPTHDAATMKIETQTLPINCHAGARILLLFMATMLFATAWDSDARHQEAVLAQRRGIHTTRTIARQTEPWQRSSQHRDQTQSPMSRGQVEVRGVGQTREWPLPVGMTSGEYRVVDSLGAVEMIQVTCSELRQRGIAEGRDARDMYLIDEPTRRIYFVRINQSERITRR